MNDNQRITFVETDTHIDMTFDGLPLVHLSKELAMARGDGDIWPVLFQVLQTTITEEIQGYRQVWHVWLRQLYDEGKLTDVTSQSQVDAPAGVSDS